LRFWNRSSSSKAKNDEGIEKWFEKLIEVYKELGPFYPEHSEEWEEHFVRAKL